MPSIPFTPVVVNSQDSADLSGTLKCEATGSDFVMLDDVKVKVTGCTIGSVGEDGNAAEVYRDNLELGGEWIGFSTGRP